jgi:hypothetical protein
MLSFVFYIPTRISLSLFLQQCEREGLCEGHLSFLCKCSYLSTLLNLCWLCNKLVPLYGKGCRELRTSIISTVVVLVYSWPLRSHGPEIFSAPTLSRRTETLTVISVTLVHHLGLYVLHFLYCTSVSKQCKSAFWWEIIFYYLEIKNMIRKKLLRKFS